MKSLLLAPLATSMVVAFAPTPRRSFAGLSSKHGSPLSILPANSDDGNRTYKPSPIDTAPFPHSLNKCTFNHWRLLASSDKNGGEGDKYTNSTEQRKKTSFQALALTSLALVVLASDRYLPVPSVPVAEFLILAAAGIVFLGAREQ